MKKYIITIFALLCCQTMMAQADGCLIVKEFSPDSWEKIDGNHRRIDMDDDGEWDFEYYTIFSSFLMIAPMVYGRYGACTYTTDESYASFVSNVFYDIYTPFNDSTLSWEDSFHGPRIFSVYDWGAQYHLDTIPFKGGIRNGQEGEYYYGWMEAYAVVSYGYDTCWFYLARTGYCTIPNYPLRWGQTSLTQDLEENESTAVASIYPNPANATLTIVGEGLKQIEITNMLGQRVATHQAEGPQATIDISALPTGIYFVGITDENGKRCVRKVVKE